MSVFASPELWPFVLSAGIMIALAAVEGATLLVGASVSHWLDGAFAGDHPDGLPGSALGWLHVGKVPILALIVIFLTSFALAGFLVQFAVRGASGHYLPPILAAAIALAAALASVHVLGQALARVIPKEETNAVPDASLVGRVGMIVIGAATVGNPAEARVRDEFGTLQYVMVEPEGADETLQSGASVLLVRHLDGRRFHAIRNPKPELL